MKFNRTVTIKTTSEKTWEGLTELEQIKGWNSCLLKNEKISDGEIRKGFRSKSLIKEGKKEVWYEEEILEFTPFTKLKLKISGKNLGKNPMFSEYQLNEVAGETQLIQTLDWQPSGIFLKLFHSAIEKMSIKSIEAELENLKKYLEK